MLQTAFWITSLLIWLPFIRTPSHFLHLKNFPPCESCWEAVLSPVIQAQPISVSLSWAKGTGIGPNQVHLLQLAMCQSQDHGERGSHSCSGGCGGKIRLPGRRGGVWSFGPAGSTQESKCGPSHSAAVLSGPHGHRAQARLAAVLWPTILLINVLSAQVSCNWDWDMQVSYIDGWNNWKLKVQILIYEMTPNPTGRWVVPSILTL